MASTSAELRFQELSIRGRFSRQEALPGWSQQALASARVLVAGAGALGNELLKNLALLGVGTLGVIDFDLVEETNLPRCALFRSSDVGRPKAEIAAARLRDLSPSLRTVPYVADLLTDVGAGLLQEYDLLLGAVDSVAARWQLNRLARRAGLRWIDGGVDAHCGQVAVFDPAEGACYECGLTATMWAGILERHSCGAPGEPAPGRPPLAVALPVVALTAALGAQEAVRSLMPSTGEHTSVGLRPGERLSVSLHPYDLSVLHTRIRASCLAHAEDRGAAQPADTTTTASVDELLQATGAGSVQLDWEVIHTLVCSACGPSPQASPVWKLRREHLACPQCGRDRAPEQISSVPRGDPLARHTLAKLGVPPKAHLRLKNQSGDRTFWCKIA